MRINKNILNGPFEKALFEESPGLTPFERLHQTFERAGAGFPLLFETNPEPFLKLINEWVNDTLNEEDPEREDKIKKNRQALRRYHGSPNLEQKYNTLIHSLANVAWDERYILDAAAALVKIEEIAGTGTAISALRTTLLPWNPNTYAPLYKRKAALKAIADLNLASSWQLLISLLPKQITEHAFSNPAPFFRRDGADKKEKLTWGHIRESYHHIANLCVKLAEDDTERWRELLNGMQYSRWDLLEDRSYQDVLTSFADKYETFYEQKQRQCLDFLRDTVDSFGEDVRYGRVPDEELKKRYAEMLEKAEAIVPASERLQYVFEAMNRRLRREGLAGNATNEEYEEYMEASQRRAIDVIYQEEGNAGIAKVAIALNNSYNQDLLARAFLSLKGDKTIKIKAQDYFDFVLENAESIQPADEAARKQLEQFCVILSGRLAREYPKDWPGALKARSANLTPETLALLVKSWPNNRKTWQYVANLGPEVERLNWENMEMPTIRGLSEEEAEEMVDKLLRYERARRAAGAIAHDHGKIEPEKIKTIIEAALLETDKPAYFAPHFPLHISWLLNNLAKDEELQEVITEQEIADWQLAFYLMLPFEEKEGLLLERYLLKHPEYFADILRLGFKKDNGEEEKRGYTYKEQLQAKAVWFVFERTLAVPGQTWQDGLLGKEIDEESLLNWVQEAIEKAAENQQQEIALRQIGKMLGAAPENPETEAWPHPAVIAIVEYLYGNYPERFDNFISSIVVGKANRRGVLSRKIGSGGELKREEAKKIEAEVAALPPEEVGTRRLLEAWLAHTLRNADFFDEIDEEDRFR